MSFAEICRKYAEMKQAEIKKVEEARPENYLRRFAKSGMSAVAFIRKIGIACTTFDYHLKRGREGHYGAELQVLLTQTSRKNKSTAAAKENIRAFAQSRAEDPTITIAGFTETAKISKRALTSTLHRARKGRYGADMQTLAQSINTRDVDGN